MTENNNFVRQSLDINLFFLRIMKEHALFLSVGFIPNNSKYFMEALRLNEHFNSLLQTAVELAKGSTNINNDVVTEFTLDAETAVSNMSQIPIDTSLTKLELNLLNQSINRISSSDFINEVRLLNDRAIRATSSIIRFKSKILDELVTCKIVYNVYPLLIEHIRREAILFVNLLNALQNNASTEEINNLIENELFWNKIMEEHSEFIRGLLDPTEKDLIKLADDFANKFQNLNVKVYNTLNNPSQITNVTKESYNLTREIKEFKTTATKGLLNCAVRSILNPLLADHVLREANHYLLLLNAVKKH